MEPEQSAIDGSVGLLGFTAWWTASVSTRKDAAPHPPSCDYTTVIWVLEEAVPSSCCTGMRNKHEKDFVFIDKSTSAHRCRATGACSSSTRTGAITNILEGHDKDAVAISATTTVAVHLQQTRGMTLRVWDLETGQLQQVSGTLRVRGADTCAIDPLHGLW